MAGILTLSDDLSLDVLRTHWRFATARIKSDPNAASYAAGFTSFALVARTTVARPVPHRTRSGAS